MTNVDLDLARILGRSCLYVYDVILKDDVINRERLKRLQIDPESELDRVNVIFDDTLFPTSYAAVLDFVDYRVVVFQGTITQFGPRHTPLARFTSAVDWIQDFHFLPSPDWPHEGRVHSGFHLQLLLIYNKLQQILSRKNTPIVLTGHSQGGGIALVAARQLLADGFAIQHVYTFGAPRVGDDAFADALRSTDIVRFEYGNDIVPHAPPLDILRYAFQSAVAALTPQGEPVPEDKDVPQATDLFIGYADLGTLAYQPSGGSLSVVSGDLEKTLLSTQRTLQLATAGKKLITDHSLVNHYLPSVLGIPLAEQ